MLKDVLRYKLTYTIILINLIAYSVSGFLSDDFIDIDLEVLVNMGAVYAPFIIEDGQWWRVFTAMFLHGGLLHLLMNMFSLYLIGRSVELYFKFSAYLVLYLFSGIFAGFFSLYMHTENAVGVGASGAIFGLFGALAGFFLAHKSEMKTHSKAFMKDFGIILGINLIIGLSIPSVDVSAHIGGLIVGILGGFVLSKNPHFLLYYSIIMFLLSLFIISMLHNTYASIIL
jgi:rhomboid protease GluP